MYISWPPLISQNQPCYMRMRTCLLDARSVREIWEAVGHGGGELSGGDHLRRVAQPRTDLDRPRGRVAPRPPGDCTGRSNAILLRKLKFTGVRVYDKPFVQEKNGLVCICSYMQPIWGTNCMVWFLAKNCLIGKLFLHPAFLYKVYSVFIFCLIDLFLSLVARLSNSQ